MAWFRHPRFDRLVLQVSAVLVGMVLVMLGLRWHLARQQGELLAGMTVANAQLLATTMLRHDDLQDPRALAEALQRLVDSSGQHVSAAVFEGPRSVASQLRSPAPPLDRRLHADGVDGTTMLDGMRVDEQGHLTPRTRWWQFIAPMRVIELPLPGAPGATERRLRLVVSLQPAREAQRQLLINGLYTVGGLMPLLWGTLWWALRRPRVALREAGSFAGSLAGAPRQRLASTPSNLAAVDTLREALNRVADVLAEQREQQRRSAEQLADTALRANAASEAKSRFLANMSHEIRTPLHGILGMTDLALARADDTTQRRQLETARGSATTLLHIVNEILDLSKIEAGQMRIEAAPFDLVAMLASLQQAYAALANAKGLRLHAAWPLELPAQLLGDSLRLRQVLANLLDNAVKFTAQGEVRLEVAMGPRRPAVEGLPRCELSFEVSDSGTGIAPERRQRVFEAFAQADDSTSRHHGGTGLGLTISLRLVAAMGGRLQLLEAPQGGTRLGFTLSLPVPHLQQVPAAAPSALPPIDQALAGTRVLLAEDNEVNALVAGALLDRMGARWQRATNGREALALTDVEPFDVVLMDLQMPYMDGHEALAALRRREAEAGSGRLPVVALTAHLFDDDLRHGRLAQEGFDAYLGKPFEAAQLLAVMRAAMAREGAASSDPALLPAAHTP